MIKIRLSACAIAMAAVAGLYLATASPATAGANLLSNGSFEDTPAPAGSFTDLTAGQTMGAWTITNGSVDLINGYWQAEDGTQSVDMSGLDAGTIAQTVGTNAGQEYQLSFWMAGNTDGGNAVKSLTSLINGQDVAGSPFLFNSAGQSKSDMGWTEYSYDFVSAGGPTTVSFQSNEQNPYGPALDNVSLKAVPEASTLVLFGLLLVGGSIVLIRKRSTRSIEG